MEIQLPVKWLWPANAASEKSNSISLQCSSQGGEGQTFDAVHVSKINETLITSRSLDTTELYWAGKWEQNCFLFNSLNFTKHEITSIYWPKKNISINIFLLRIFISKVRSSVKIYFSRAFYMFTGFQQITQKRVNGMDIWKKPVLYFYFKTRSIMNVTYLLWVNVGLRNVPKKWS